MQTPGMDRWTTLKLALTVLAVLAFGLTRWVQPRELPFHLEIEQHTDAGIGVVKARPMLKLPSTLRAGDRVLIAQQTPRMRAVLENENVPGDAAYTLLVKRADVLLPVAVRSVPVPRAVTSKDPLLLGMLADWLALALGILTLWRGRDWAAWGLAMLVISSVLRGAALALALPPFANIALHAVGDWLGGPMAFIGLYLTVQALLGGQPTHRSRWHLAYAVTLMMIFGVELAGIVNFVWAGGGALPQTLQLLLIALGLAALGVPLALLLHGYNHAEAESRLRIRWILFGSMLLLPLLVMSLLQENPTVQHSATIILWMGWLHPLLVVGVLGFYTFAVLRRRLVEVRVVLNRALVFGTLMALVVGLFAFVESLIERRAVGESAGLAIEIGVPLALGVLFHHLHRRVEALVDRLFFRREHHARAELGAFVRDAGYIESPQVLVQRAVATFGRCAGGLGAALYEARAWKWLRSGRDEAGAAYPAAIDEDDPALVRLRATLTALDLHGLDSRLGAEGLALPLALRGQLFGVLLCGPPSAGRHAQADIDRLAQAAHEVGAALFALRARANEALVESLANGRMDLDQAAAQARQLLAGTPGMKS